MTFQLPVELRGAMEQTLRADFSDVCVHVGTAAGRIGAVAFACGSNIVFARGAYNPESLSGQRLIAHELMHVAQQRAGRVSNPSRESLAVIADPWLEAQAEQVAASMKFVPLRSDWRRNAPAAHTARAFWGVCIQMAAAAHGNPGNPPPPSTWARIKQELTSPVVLTTIGIIGVGVLCYKYQDQLLQSKIVADSAATLGSKLFSPKTAADYFLNYVARQMSGPATLADSAAIVIKGYASLIIPYGGLLATPVGLALKTAWNGVSPIQQFAINVFQALPNDWRNQFIRHAAPGLVALAGARWLSNFDLSTMPPGAPI